MRRRDRQITDINRILDILDQSAVARIAMVTKENTPYIVPMNYGYTYIEGALCLYFHCANEGRKLDILKQNNNVCFEIGSAHSLITGGQPEAYSYAYESIIGFGKVSFLMTEEEKIRGLNVLFRHQTGRDIQCDLDPAALKATTVFALTVEEFTAKRNK